MTSVIVPVLNDFQNLQRLLACLLEEPGDLEIIVADGGSADGSGELALGTPQVHLVRSPRGRGQQMNAGARAASGDVLLFLHADTRPPRGSAAGLSSLLEKNGADFGAFRLAFDRTCVVPAILSRLTAMAHPWTCFGDQAMFASREFFERTGGFDEIPLLEDAHWARRAGRLGRMVRHPEAVTTSARRFAGRSGIRQSLLNLSILLRDLAGQDPETLAAMYCRGAGAAPEICDGRVERAA